MGGALFPGVTVKQGGGAALLELIVDTEVLTTVLLLPDLPSDSGGPAHVPMHRTAILVQLPPYLPSGSGASAHVLGAQSCFRSCAPRTPKHFLWFAGQTLWHHPWMLLGAAG